MASSSPIRLGRELRGGGPSGKRNGGSSTSPLSAGLDRQPNTLLPEVSERQLFSRFSDAALLAFLTAAAALPYLNTLRNGFVSDDETQVLHNPYIRNFHYLARIFTTRAASYVPGASNYYRPLMNLGYLLCYRVFGVDAFGYHLANLILNAAVVCAVFLLTKRMFQNRDLALIAAALFAVHPIHSEAVAWVGASPDLEVSLFYLLTFWLFLGVARPGGRFSYAAQVAMAGSFVLTIFSKEQAVTLPVLATVYEHFYRPDRRETRPGQKVQRYVILWLLTAAYLVFRVYILGALSSGFRVHHLDWYQTTLSAVALLGQYSWRVIWPVDLRIFCPFIASLSLFDPRVLGGLAAVGACLALFVYLWRRERPLSFGLLWLLAPLGPVLNARWMPVAAFEERYLFLPSVGLCWLLGWGFLRLWAQPSSPRPVWRPALAAALGILEVLCLLRIVARNRDWRDNLTLYTHTLAACPAAYYVRRDLGLVYWNAGDDISAEREWREALKAGPNYAPTWSSLGLMYLRKQDYPQAIEFFKKALEFDLNNPEARLYLGVAYLDTHAPALAEPELRAAVSLNPLSANARNALGKLCVETGRTAEAEKMFRQSAEMEPNAAAYGNLGMIHWRGGEARLAEQEWREALRLAPNDSSLLNNLGLACTELERYTEAASFFRKAVALNPQDPNPHSNLGIAYEKAGQLGPAETEFRTALSLVPQKFATRNRLGMLYLQGGRLGEAEKQFHLSLETQANDAGYCGLGEIYLRRGDRAAAQRAFQSAASLDPSNSLARFQLGALYLAQGRKAEALREYQAGLKIDPENPGALATVEKLNEGELGRRVF